MTTKGIVTAAYPTGGFKGVCMPEEAKAMGLPDEQADTEEREPGYSLLGTACFFFPRMRSRASDVW